MFRLPVGERRVDGGPVVGDVESKEGYLKPATKECAVGAIR